MGSIVAPAEAPQGFGEIASYRAHQRISGLPRVISLPVESPHTGNVSVVAHCRISGGDHIMLQLRSGYELSFFDQTLGNFSQERRSRILNLFNEQTFNPRQSRKLARTSSV
jgi:hypothetical protein